MEIFDIYDKDRNLTGRTVPRGQPLGKGEYHMAIHVCIFNAKGQMLIQQRQPFKKGWSGMWDVTVGGSAQSGETSAQAAERETFEEIGYKIDLSDERPVMTVNFDVGFDDWYILEREVDMDALSLQYEEVQRVKWADEREIRRLIEKGEFIEYFVMEAVFAMRKQRGAYYVTYLLFDLDGTLSDPYEGIINSFKYAAEKLGFEIPDKDDLRWVIGPPLRKIISKLGVPDGRVEEAVKAFREYFVPTGLYENSLYNGIKELLQELNKKYILALATSKVGEYAKNILEYFGISEYFHFIGGAELDGSRSEKHEVIEHVIQSLNISNRDKVYMIGDREHDVIGAKKAGVKSVGALWGYGSAEELTKAGADYIAGDFEALRKLFKLNAAEKDGL